MRGRWIGVLGLGLLLMLAGLALPAPAVRAGNFTVTNLFDSGPGSLRDAIIQADTAPGSTIGFAVTGAITLTNPLPLLTADMAITGPGAAQLTVNGTNASAVFTLSGPITVSISGLTVTGGSGANGGGISAPDAARSAATLNLTSVIVSNNIASNGGGIFSRGNLTVTSSLISGNTGSNSGGGIYVEGTLTVADSTISGNMSGQGGGMNPASATVTVTRSTFTGNRDTARTGGIWLEGGSMQVTNSTFSGDTGASTGEITAISNATLTVINSTITGAAGVFNSGISSIAGSTVFLTNTILVGAGNQCKLAGGTITSHGHNLSLDTSCGLASTGDQQGVHPLLGALANNGGPTLTQEFRPGSFAIDVGDNTACAAFASDQRGAGFPRVLFGTCDIGAVEYPFLNVAIITAQPVGQTVFATQPLSLSVTATNNHPLSYQWRQNGSPIGGATSSTYTKTAVLVDAGSYDVVVTNGAGSVTSNAVTVTVNAPPTITLTPTALPAGTKGAVYTQQTLTATGGTAPSTFSVTVGTLPPGLTLNATTGVLSGTPTAVGTFPFTVQAKDTQNFTGTQPYTVTINPASLTSIAISAPVSGSPTNVTDKVGQIMQLTAIGAFGDGSTGDVTTQVTWMSSNPQIAIVDASGKVTGKSGGTVTITATLNGVTQTITITVPGPTAIGIQVPPAPASRPSETTSVPSGGPAPDPLPTGR